MNASTSLSRVGAVVRKELEEFRRNRFILTTAGVLPLIFLISPTAQILTIHASATSALLARRIDLSLFFLLLIPVFLPATMSAFSVVGEREQGTLEPVLTTPVSRVELLAGKATAIFIPAVVFGPISLLIIWLGLKPYEREVQRLKALEAAR